MLKKILGIAQARRDDWDFEYCLECDKLLKNHEKESGFCKSCDAKINNDFKLLDEEESNFALETI